MPKKSQSCHPEKGAARHSDWRDEGSHHLLAAINAGILRGIYPESVGRRTEVLRGVYPERNAEVLRSAQDDTRRAQNDTRKVSLRDMLEVVR
jgi:hypothetical protein